MDFSAWFEGYLGDRWYTFDARHNIPLIGRILIARGRDATDVAITTSYGLHQQHLRRFVADSVIPSPRIPSPFDRLGRVGVEPVANGVHLLRGSLGSSECAAQR